VRERERNKKSNARSFFRIRRRQDEFTEASGRFIPGVLFGRRRRKKKKRGKEKRLQNQTVQKETKMKMKMTTKKKKMNS